jgi:DNA-binding HxlR family transcriptional regulator
MRIDVQKLKEKECEEYSCTGSTGIDYGDCPIGVAIALIGGKWKLPILYNLRGQTMRFNALKKALPGVTQKMLTQQLRELERDGLVGRKVYAEVPPKVEYSLTPIAKKLEPILDSMCSWGMEYRRLRGV